MKTCVGRVDVGELMRVLDPALASSPRPKMHYRGRVPQQRTESGDAFAQNEVRLLLNALAYNLVHAVRLAVAARRRWPPAGRRDRVVDRTTTDRQAPYARDPADVWVSKTPAVSR